MFYICKRRVVLIQCSEKDVKGINHVTHVFKCYVATDHYTFDQTIVCVLESVGGSELRGIYTTQNFNRFNVL